MPLSVIKGVCKRSHLVPIAKVSNHTTRTVALLNSPNIDVMWSFVSRPSRRGFPPAAAFGTYLAGSIAPNHSQTSPVEVALCSLTPGRRGRKERSEVSQHVQTVTIAGPSPPIRFVALACSRSMGCYGS